LQIVKINQFYARKSQLSMFESCDFSTFRYVVFRQHLLLKSAAINRIFELNRLSSSLSNKLLKCSLCVCVCVDVWLFVC